MQRPNRFHFIGVGGSGMSAIAAVFVARGFQVSGSDRQASRYFQALAEAGIAVQVGHDPALVAAADVVVVSTAIREDNPELLAARATGKEVWHRSTALAHLVADAKLIAIAGSHGKTTTTAMTGWALHHAEIDASMVVGAKLLGLPGAVAGGYPGSSPVMVIEADESDRSFLRYRPEIAVVTAIEADHLDNYGSLAELEQEFFRFANQSQKLLVCAEDAGAVRLGRKAQANGVETYFYGSAAVGAPAGLQLDFAVFPDRVQAGSRVDFSGEFPLTVPFPGWHNQLNATAAWVSACLAGADPELSARGLASFAGTGRRFETRWESAEFRIIDDYAHHPTEVAAVVAAARAAGAGRLIVLFQPALFTRTRDFASEFAHALSVPDADIVLAPVYGDREDPLPGVDSGLIASQIAASPNSQVYVTDSLAAAAEQVATLIRPDDWVLTVGSGSVTNAADQIVAAYYEGKRDA